MIPAGAFMDFFRILRRKGLTKPRLRCRIGERKCRENWGVRGSVHDEAPARLAEVYEERGTCCSISVRIRLWDGAPVLDERCRAALHLESRPGAISRLSNIAGGFRICSSPQRRPQTVNPGRFNRDARTKEGTARTTRDSGAGEKREGKEWPAGRKFWIVWTRLP